MARTASGTQVARPQSKAITPFGITIPAGVNNVVRYLHWNVHQDWHPSIKLPQLIYSASHVHFDKFSWKCKQIKDKVAHVSVHSMLIQVWQVILFSLWDNLHDIAVCCVLYSVYVTMFYGPRLTIKIDHMSICYALTTIISGCASTHLVAPASDFGKQKEESATVLSLLPQTQP